MLCRGNRAGTARLDRRTAPRSVLSVPPRGRARQSSAVQSSPDPLHAGGSMGSHPEIIHRAPTLSRVTRTLDAASAGGEPPTWTVWSTNTSTTAWLSDADTDAAAGTRAVADTCRSFALGISTSRVTRE